MDKFEDLDLNSNNKEKNKKKKFSRPSINNLNIDEINNEHEEKDSTKNSSIKSK